MACPNCGPTGCTCGPAPSHAALALDDLRRGNAALAQLLQQAGDTLQGCDFVVSSKPPSLPAPFGRETFADMEQSIDNPVADAEQRHGGKHITPTQARVMAKQLQPFHAAFRFEDLPHDLTPEQREQAASQFRYNAMLTAVAQHIQHFTGCDSPDPQKAALYTQALVLESAVSCGDYDVVQALLPGLAHALAGIHPKFYL